MKIGTMAGIALAAAASLGSAEAQTIVDGGFEAANVTPGNAPSYNIGTMAIPGWMVINHDGTTQTATNNHDVAVVGNGAFGLNTPFGTDFLDLTGYSDTPAYSGVAQMIATTAGQAYTLSFWLGASVTDSRYAGPVGALVYFGSQTATVLNDGVTTMTAPNMIWSLQSVTFTASAASTQIGIVGNLSTGGQFIGLDNVSIAAANASPVPEPASWALMLTGLGAAGYAMRRRRAIVTPRAA